MSRNNEYGNYGGRWPAIVRAYDAQLRLCAVEIPGITDGAETLPVAEIEYPIGDRSSVPIVLGMPMNGAVGTEIDIREGDAVWVAFIGGDSRYPIITGYRNGQIDNDTGTRRWKHTNVELVANSEIRFTAGGDIVANAGDEVTVDAGGKIDVTAGGNVKVVGALIFLN